MFPTESFGAKRVEVNNRFEGSGRFRKLWESCRVNDALISYQNDFMAPSYQQEQKEHKKQLKIASQTIITSAQEDLKNTSHCIIQRKSRIQCKLCMQSVPDTKATECLLTTCPKKPTPNATHHTLDRQVTFLDQADDTVKTIINESRWGSICRSIQPISAVAY